MTLASPSAVMDVPGEKEVDMAAIQQQMGMMRQAEVTVAPYLVEDDMADLAKDLTDEDRKYLLLK